jgi:hypothetical protein
MSSTSNVQNLLTNVFRPRHTYDTVANFFQTRVEMSNIDTLYANVAYLSNAYVGDSNSNVYVGVGAGNSYVNTQSNFLNTAMGPFAGSNISNASNSVFLGYSAGANVVNARNTILIGTATFGNGNSNIFIGTSNGVTSGSCNIFLGQTLAYPGGTSNNTLRIGNGVPTILGDLSSHTIGINVFPRDTAFALDVSGYVHISNAGIGINSDPRDHTLNVNGDMYVTDGHGVFALSNVAGNSVLSYDPVLPATATVNFNATVNIKTHPVPFIQYGSVVVDGSTLTGTVALLTEYPNSNYAIQLTTATGSASAPGVTGVTTSNFTFTGTGGSSYYWTTFGAFP